MRAAPLFSSRDTPHWSRVCVNALLVLGVVAMLNMLGANSESMAPLGSSHDTSMSHAQTAVPLADAEDSGRHLAPAMPIHDGGLSVADCCGLVMLCVAMIVGISAFVLSGRPSGGRLMWQMPRPHTFTLGRAVAPFFSISPLQRTAVLRL